MPQSVRPAPRFRPGSANDPLSARGFELIAHGAVHAQAHSRANAATGLAVSSPHDRAETEAERVARTTLHESRHAEQHFLAARFSAGVKNNDAGAIVAEQHIPQSIADQAVAKKFNAGTDSATAALGQKMYEATVTDGTTNAQISNDDGITELNAKRATAQNALNMLAMSVTPQTISDAKAAGSDLKAQILIVEQKYPLYRAIPYEADAHEVGDAAELAFRGWPTPRATQFGGRKVPKNPVEPDL
jgi:hypothetical protein